MAQHIFTIRRVNFERFYSEQYRVRRDFDKIFAADSDETLTKLTLEKYELYIERYFEPYAAMHESRMHSNLWGKNVPWGDAALETDHVGYYKPRLAHSEPTDVAYHEEYPHMVGAWVYDHNYLDAEFDYTDKEKDYFDGNEKRDEATVKSQLDNAHQ